MTIYDTIVSIHDGEAEYTQHHYTNTSSIEKAERSAIKNYGFSRKAHFSVHRRDKDGNPNVWEEKPGYRLYELESTQPAKIYVDGMNSIDLSELASRPVLPFFSKDAGWIWSISNQVEYWWYHGDYIVVAMYYPERLSENDSCLSITTFPYWDFKKHCDSMVENKWFLVKGDIDG